MLPVEASTMFMSRGFLFLLGVAVPVEHHDVIAGDPEGIGSSGLCQDEVAWHRLPFRHPLSNGGGLMWFALKARG